MWEYKVLAGAYFVDGGNVFIKNPAGEGSLQQALDHYGAERWELVSTHLDGVQREAVLVLKRLRAGAVAPPVAAMPAGVPVSAMPGPAPTPAAAPSGRTFVDPDGEVVRRRAPGSPPAAPRSAPAAPPAPTAAPPPSAPAPGGTGRRRSKADLDRLARDD